MLGASVLLGASVGNGVLLGPGVAVTTTMTVTTAAPPPPPPPPLLQPETKAGATQAHNVSTAFHHARRFRSIRRPLWPPWSRKSSAQNSDVLDRCPSRYLAALDILALAE
jgi:hypothetical protein